jgi:serine/threonine protein kinase
MLFIYLFVFILLLMFLLYQLFPSLRRRRHSTDLEHRVRELEKRTLATTAVENQGEQTRFFGDEAASRRPSAAAVTSIAPEVVRAEAVTVPPPTSPAFAAAGTRPHDFLGPPQASDEIGRLGPYRVLQVLGTGGMGVVFRAEDPQLQRPVALKAMLPLIAANPANRQRFLREARAAAAITHDHIVTIFQVGEDRGLPFLAMQLLQGESLEDRVRRERKLPVAEIVRIGREVADGLAAAHAHGLVHRDIKPGNIWLEGNRGRVKILDFGLARPATDAVKLTQSGAIVGTPAYMAPEQARADQVDARADLFSLGCVLYRMSTGTVPFRGDDMIALLAALALDTPTSPREVNPEIPAALSDLVMHLLAKNPADRPESATVVIEALDVIAGISEKGPQARV